MRLALAGLLPALLVACSSAPPTATCTCCCCQPDPTPGRSFSSYGQSVFNDHNDDGIPDDRQATEVFVDTNGDDVRDLHVRISTLFADTDDDGVPDTRVLALGGSTAGLVRTLITRASMDVVRAADQQQLEAALNSMQVALDNARRAIAIKR